MAGGEYTLESASVDISIPEVVLPDGPPNTRDR
jgi:hypothetical protein